ncbi:MAG: hypothetical protein CVU51_11615 [Deltaproteobacteria bacterium HGW-Deltaproteobacteria-1]|nr:MAG: hypothetical protein CVU51_11615 [Deltaproteobacteria bacterium HGW-Deltaproteobacteria-1]
MKLSTRTRYGVRLMVALAQNYGKGPVLLKDIARGENISEKYLSLIIIPLRAVNLVNSVRLEGDCSLVDCVHNPSSCSRVPICASHDIWEIVGNKISEILSSITLDMLVKMNQEKAVNIMMQDI